MKKLKLLLLGLALIFSAIIGTACINHEVEPISSTVYVCGKSTIYHDASFHAALKRCKSGISTMTETKAINLGKRECKCRDQ